MASPRRTSVDIAPLMAKLRAIPGAFEGVVKPLVHQESRLFVRDVVKWTPPASQGSVGLQAKAQGEAAVQRDIAKIYGTASKAYIDLALLNKPLAKAFWKLVQEGNFQDARQMLQEFGSDRYRNTQSIATFDGGAMHQRFRRRGRVTRDRVMVLVTDPKQLEAYAKEMKSRVGLLASGWARAARKLGQPLPAWVTRHGESRGACIILDRGDRIMIIMSNRVRYGVAQDMQRRADYVMGYRKRALEKRMPYVIRAALRKAGLGN